MVKNNLNADKDIEAKHSSLNAKLECFGDRLKFAMSEETPYALSKRTGITESLIRKYISGASLPNIDRGAELADALKISLDWLARGIGPMRLGESAQPQKQSLAQQDYYYLPLYDVRASAGHGALNHTEDEVDKLAFKRQWIRKELGTQPDQLCLIYIVGESMEPTLHANDVILIDRSVKEITTDGIYVLMLDGNLLTKRCQRLPGRKIRVSSDNPAYEPFILDDEMHSPDQHLIGRVVWAGRKF